MNIYENELNLFKRETMGVAVAIYKEFEFA